MGRHVIPGDRQVRLMDYGLSAREQEDLDETVALVEEEGRRMIADPARRRARRGAQHER